MEHADIISGAFTYTKDAFFGLKQFPRWIVLFLYFVIPILCGLVVASILLHLILQPFLVNLLVNDNYGFTVTSISGLLQYAAVILGLACVLFVPLIQGYCYRIFKSDGKELPDHTNLWGLFFQRMACQRGNFVLCYPDNSYYNDLLAGVLIFLP